MIKLYEARFQDDIIYFYLVNYTLKNWRCVSKEWELPKDDTLKHWASFRRYHLCDVKQISVRHLPNHLIDCLTNLEYLELKEQENVETVNNSNA